MRVGGASVLVLAAVAGSSAAQAVDPTVLMVGEQGPFFAGDNDFVAASDGAWFVFTLTETTLVDIDINRNQAVPDLFASLYSGDITGVDATALSPDGLINGILFSDFGPLTFLVNEDDTEDDAFGGLFGDPRFTLELDPGTYSIVVAAVFQPEGGDFSIISNVPTPGSTALLGLGGLLAARRRR